MTDELGKFPAEDRSDDLSSFAPPTTAAVSAEPPPGFEPPAHAGPPEFAPPEFGTLGAGPPGYDTPAYDTPGFDTPGYETPGYETRSARWGLGDVLLGVPFILVVTILATLLTIPFVGFDTFTAGDELSLSVLSISLLAQQMAQGTWPFIVSRWKGLGPVKDWRLGIGAFDPLYGFATALGAVGLAAVLAATTSQLVGLEDSSEAENTQFLVDAEGTPWLYLLIVLVVIGAPLAEEFFFRGLCLRAFEKRLGKVWAVIGSTLLFTLPHFTGAGLDGTIVLLASIGGVGLVLGTVTVVLGRIWPAVFAHMLFNGIGVIGALELIDVPQ